MESLPDFSPVVGHRFDYRVDVVNHNGKVVHGVTWEIVGQNKGHVPYVSRVVHGKCQMREYAGPMFTLMAKRLLEALVGI